MPLTSATPSLPDAAATWPLDAPWGELRYYEEVASTQKLATGRVQQGEDLRGVALWSETQTGGVGRTGNHWHSVAGGVYVSAVLPGTVLPVIQVLSWYPLAAALSALELLQERYNVAARIKWPNDLLIEAGPGMYKLAGVLGELARPRRAVNGFPGALVVALGLNWTNRAELPAPPAATAGTGEAVLGPISLTQVRPGVRDDERRLFIAAWLERLAQWHAGLQTDVAATTRELVRAVEPRLWLRGRPVRMTDSEQGTVEGQLLGLGENAAARLRLEGGKLADLHCGQLRAL